MFGQFTNLVADASAWAYVVIVTFAVLDALLPIVPSEATVITAGVVAASGGLEIALVVACAAVGAFAGDNAVYWIGRRWGERVRRKFFSGEKGKKRVAWADRQLRERSGELIMAGRFIPGGRTAVALSAGTLDYAWPKYARYDAVAATLWAAYAGLLGYFGGRAFEDAPWKGLLLAFGIALAITVGTEGVRHLIARRRG